MGLWLDEALVLPEDALGIRELAGVVELFGNAAWLEVGVEVLVVVVDDVFTIAFAKAGLKFAILALGLVTVMEPPRVLARLAVEVSLVLVRTINFQEMSLPTSPPALSSMVRVQLPLAFFSLKMESTDSGLKVPVKGAVPVEIALLASSSNKVLVKLSPHAPLRLDSTTDWPVGEVRVITRSESAV